MRLGKRLERLQAQLPPPPSETEREWARCWNAVLDRMEALVVAVAPLLSEAEQQRLGKALDQWGDSGSSSSGFGRWLLDLERGRCRLPELSPATTRALLLAWLSEEVDSCLSGMTCQKCGLEHPRRRQPPHFFGTCPHCGETAWDWPHHALRRPWQQLDGVVPPREFS